MTAHRIARLAGRLGAVLLGLELFYVLVANTLLFSGAIEHAASLDPDKTAMDWDRAWSPWPGRAYVSGFRLRVQDPVQEFRLTVEHAKVNVVLWELLRKRFRASYVKATGVSYRMLLKVDGTAGRERRLAAFPPLEGFASPALTPQPPPPPATAADIAGLWCVELDEVDATINELWFLEYRYRGPARVHGGFALDPLRKLWVGPALLLLDGGLLSAGEHTLSSRFAASVAVTVAPADLPSSPGLRILRTLTASIQLDTALEDLDAAALYVNGLHLRGTGRLAATVQISDGKLAAGTALDLTLSGVALQLQGYRFAGETKAKLSVANDSTGAKATATLTGRIEVPWFGKLPVSAALSKVTADLAFTDNDLAQGLHVQHIRAAADARVDDAKAITRAAGDILPIAAPIVLGDGPLLASATFHMTAHPVVRLTQLTLGSAEIEGAAIAETNGWNGAAAGHFGALQLGLRLRDSKLETVPFPSTSWLVDELPKAGIRPD